MTKVEKLEAALAWALSEGAKAQDFGEQIEFRDAGCSCCSGSVEPAEEWRDVVMKAARTALGKSGSDRNG